MRATQCLCMFIIIACVFGLPAYAESAENNSRHFTPLLQERIDTVASLGIVYATAMRKCTNDLYSKTLAEHERRRVDRLVERTYILIEEKLDPSLEKFIAMSEGRVPPNIDALYAQMLANLDEQKRLTRDWCALNVSVT